METITDEYILELLERFPPSPSAAYYANRTEWLILTKGGFFPWTEQDLDRAENASGYIGNHFGRPCFLVGVMRNDHTKKMEDGIA